MIEKILNLCNIYNNKSVLFKYIYRRIYVKNCDNNANAILVCRNMFILQ